LKTRSNPLAWPALAGCVAICLCSLSAEAQMANPLARANAQLQAGDADGALAALRVLPQAGANQAEALNLSCRVHYILQHWDQAASECQKAVQLDGGNARYHLWLARALGEKASHASFLSAYSLGKQVHTEFEAAARLDPHDPEILADLGDFYQQAPGIVGGGADKAERVAQQLDAIDPARAHQLRARLAETQKDFGTAEREFKAAIAASPHPAPHWTTLASFFRRRQRWQDVEAAIHSALATAGHDKHATIALYDGAGVLIESKRDPALAAKMLENYLSADSRTEEGPAFEAHLRLARLKSYLGDAAAAERERNAALALAHDYKPALEAKF
jgi:tetratricopeptide (TPR) repeat protein